MAGGIWQVAGGIWEVAGGIWEVAGEFGRWPWQLASVTAGGLTLLRKPCNRDGLGSVTHCSELSQWIAEPLLT